MGWTLRSMRPEDLSKETSKEIEEAKLVVAEEKDRGFGEVVLALHGVLQGGMCLSAPGEAA